MNIVLVNDDGWSAVGILTLKMVLEQQGHWVGLVAPKGEQSARSGTVNFGKPLAYKKLDEDMYWVDGSPVDCVNAALFGFFKDKVIDIVISGINNGYNAGRDIFYSGTVSAAREASLFGIPSVALSCCWFPKDISSTKQEYLEKIGDWVHRNVLSFPRESYFLPGLVLNINFPELHWKKTEVVSVNKDNFYNREVLIYPFNNKSLPCHGTLVLGGELKLESSAEEFNLLFNKNIAASLISSDVIAESDFIEIEQKWIQHFSDRGIS